jgi:UDP:flavonoid glycosyltransferase YjiC (YdhE family)
MALTVLIAGGGTGGHLYPGIAVAREVQRRRRETTVVFVGTARGIESRVVPAEGFPLELIRSAGLKGKSLTARLRGAALLPLSLLDAWRGFRASLLAPDRFGAFLAIGLTMMVAAQALINISVVLSLVPTKGIPLPFVSNGGSSLLVNLMAMGILLNITQHGVAEGFPTERHLCPTVPLNGSHTAA